jgi:hypothetical protein
MAHVVAIWDPGSSEIRARRELVVTTPVALLDPDSVEYQRAFELRAAAQLWRHRADPLHVPKYLDADDDEFPSEAYTAGGPEEPY